MCEEMGVPFLGAIPLDPLIARSCDEGKSYISQAPTSLASKAYAAIFQRTTVLSNSRDPFYFHCHLYFVMVTAFFSARHRGAYHQVLIDHR